MDNDKKKDWLEHALYCSASKAHHDLVPIVKSLSEKYEHVTMFMCQKCFHTIAMDEVWMYR